MDTKPRCSKHVFSGARWDTGGHRCGKPGIVEKHEKWYCGTHNPEAEERRKAKQQAKWEADKKAMDEKFARQNYDRKAGDACRALGIVDPETELANFVRREDL